MDKMATRTAYGEALAYFGEKYDFVVLDADLSKSTKTATFQKKYPERFFNIGIAEANMMGIAAGIATTGKTVFASSFAMFAAGRAYDQIRNSICYPDLNVKIAATHAGLSNGEDGGSHQCIEDIATMRVIPDMCVISPADAIETKCAVEAAIKHEGPVYIRLSKSDVPVINDENNYQFKLGKGNLLKDGCDITIIATGSIVHEALDAATILESKNISARVINIHTIKPLDEEIIIKAAKETGMIITAEEHNVIGGLGSAVCEVLSQNYPVSVIRIGVNDKFGKSGKSKELLEEYGLTSKHIVDKAIKEIKK